MVVTDEMIDNLNLSWYCRTLGKLVLVDKISMRYISREADISYYSIRKSVNKVKAELW